jgi:hypothetical protein
MTRLFSLIVFLLLLVATTAEAQIASVKGNITAEETATDGSCTPGACIELSTQGASNGLVQVTGSWTGPLKFWGSIDGKVSFFPLELGSVNGSVVGSTTNVNGHWALTKPVTHLRVTGDDTISGTANIVMYVSIHGGGGSATVGGSVSVSNDIGVTQQTSPWIGAGVHADNSSNASNKHATIPCKVTASNPSWTEGNQAPLRCDPTTGAAYVISPENGTLVDYYPATGAANQDQNQIKASAGILYGFSCSNINAAVRYLKLYELAAPTSGSTVYMKFIIPGNTAGGGHSPNFPAEGVAFATAMGSRLTTGFADNDTDAVASGDIICNFFYR